jgi:hypothetical protein
VCNPAVLTQPLDRPSRLTRFEVLYGHEQRWPIAVEDYDIVLMKLTEKTVDRLASEHGDGIARSEFGLIPIASERLRANIVLGSPLDDARDLVFCPLRRIRHRS